MPFLIGAEGDPALAVTTPPSALIEALSQGTGMLWRAPGVADFATGAEGTAADLALQNYERDYAVQLSRHFPHRILAGELDPGCVAGAVDVDWADWNVVLASVDLWSLGVGMVTVVYGVEMRTSAWEALRDGLDRERERLRAGVVGIAAETGRAAAAALRIPASPVWGQPLWMHVIVLIEAPDDTDERDLDAIASAVAYGGLRATLDPTLKGAVARFKLDACVAFLPAQRQVAAAAARMTAVHTAVWATAAGFDRVLLDALVTPVGRQSASLSALEDRADELLDLYQRVHAFQTQLDTLPLHLGWLDMPLWRAVSEQWGLERQLKGLVARFDALDHVHSHLLDAVSGRRARRLGAFVLVFTVASVITFGVTVIDFSQTRLASPRSFNLSALAVLAALAVLIGAVALLLARRGLRGRR